MNDLPGGLPGRRSKNDPLWGPEGLLECRRTVSRRSAGDEQFLNRHGLPFRPACPVGGEKLTFAFETGLFVG